MIRFLKILRVHQLAPLQIWIACGIIEDHREYVYIYAWFNFFFKFLGYMNVTKKKEKREKNF
jgi:hypothetical protein